ncbi:MAG: type II toxin-antitoxin system prevent-host-death family antitoxin [Myxococcota bacterium]
MKEARDQFAELLNRAAYGGELIRIARRGKVIAGVVSKDDLQLIETVRERMAEEADLALALERLADPDMETKTQREVERELLK